MKLKRTESAVPVLSDDLLALMLEAVTPLPVEPRMLKRARGNLMRGVAKASVDGMEGGTRTIRGSDNAWQKFGHGVERMVVSDEGSHHAWLLRLAPGASLPAHDHCHGDEESIILGGSCVLNGELLSAGDVHLAGQGSRHDQLVSDEGCLFWLRMPANQAKALSAFADRTRAVAQAPG